MEYVLRSSYRRCEVRIHPIVSSYHHPSDSSSCRYSRTHPTSVLCEVIQCRFQPSICVLAPALVCDRFPHHNAIQSVGVYMEGRISSLIFTEVKYIVPFEIASRVRDCGNGVLKLIYILQNLFALFIFYSFIIFSSFSPLRGAGKK